MPTGIPALRPRYIASGATYSNPNATLYGTNQIFNVPFWQCRYVPNASMAVFANTMTQFVSQANRQRLSNNGGEIEITPGHTTDGVFWAGLRGTPYDFNNGGLTGGGKCSVNMGDANFKFTYTPWVGSMLHEYAHAEDDHYFIAGQEPTGKAGLSINAWPEMITLFNDCQTNGADPGAVGGHFVTSFRVPQRIEAAYGLTVGTSVRVGASGNVSTLSGTYTFDGVSLAVSDRVLLVGQTDPRQNGIWIVQTGAWTRAADTMTAGVQYTISAGTTNAGKHWTNVTPGTIVVGTTNMVWAVDSMLDSAGSGTSGGTPASRVQRWKDICTNNGWAL